ncbi:MAG TPA: B12-binding domain-containing radical SAM protein [Clostridiales bacterium]|nr:B12-binding domain-containing radical SAM protein [Clostridiales bacterium]
MDEHHPIILCGLNARYVHTNLALRDLAAYVQTHWPDAPAIRLAEWTINDQPLAILRRLYSEQAFVYGFSCYIWNISQIRRISHDLKKLCPQALIVWGGPEAASQASHWLTCEPAVDLIIRGEGEAAWLLLLQAIQTGQLADVEKLSAIPNLSWRDPVSGQIRENPAGPLLDPADWPFPYDEEHLAQLKDRIIYYETSRGCPFNCSYCLSSLDKSVRFRPLSQVFAELDLLMASGLQQVKLVDRTFNCQPDRAFKIWQYLIDHAAKAGLTNFHFEVAGDLIDDRTADLLAQAPPGLIQLEIGVQTIHPDVLRAINRPARLDRLAAQVKRLRAADNVHIHLDLIAGLPGEDLNRFAESLDWVFQLRPQQLQLGFLKVLPGSPMHDTARQRGYIWQNEPPYEILRSDALDFSDLIHLKNVAWLLDVYLNSNFCDRAFNWLTGQQERPWQVLSGLAAWTAGQGLLDRPLSPAGRCQLLWDYARHSQPELNGDNWLATAWRDLLRLDYQLSGQKDQPAWLNFPENNDESENKQLLRRARDHFRQNLQQAGRLRIERLCFDPRVWLESGELRKGRWLLCLDLQPNRPAMLDNCREDDLY